MPSFCPVSIRVERGTLCIQASCLDALKRRAPLFKARLQGSAHPDKLRTFGVVIVDGLPMLADLKTGTLYQLNGEHSSSKSLRVVDIPPISANVLDEAPQVLEVGG